jgi:2-keto-4-pentenoate hydratase
MKIKKSAIVLTALLTSIGITSSCAQDYDLNNPADQKKLAISFVDNFKEAKPISPIRAGDISEDVAYKIADFFIEEQLKFRGIIAGYKVGTFSKGEYDNGPVDGLSGPVTAAMFSKGILESGAHVSVNCCNMSFVEADFAAVVKSDAINTAETDLEILSALSGFLPFIEMPDLLQPSGGSSNVGGIATNYDFRNAIIGDLIVSQSNEEWIEKLNDFRFQMTNETGEVLADGHIKDAYDPLYRVKHLRDQLLKRGRTLKQGDILSLGNMGAIRPLKVNDYMDPEIRPVFRGNIATVSYIGLDPAGPATVSVVIDRDSK